MRPIVSSSPLLSSCIDVMWGAVPEKTAVPEWEFSCDVFLWLCWQLCSETINTVPQNHIYLVWASFSLLCSQVFFQIKGDESKHGIVTNVYIVKNILCLQRKQNVMMSNNWRAHNDECHLRLACLCWHDRKITGQWRGESSHSFLIQLLNCCRYWWGVWVNRLKICYPPN